MSTCKKIYFAATLLLATCYINAQEIYSLNWDKRDSYKISCGIIYHDTWEVRNDTCSFSSGNIILKKSGKQDLTAKITLRQDGNLTSADVAYGYIFVNEVIAKSFTITGDELEDTFTKDESFSVIGKSNVSIRIVFNGADADRAWQLKTGDVKIINNTVTEEPYLTAVFNGTTSKITWQAKTTYNSNYFIVEHSSNGQDFTLSGLVKAETSTGLREYSLIDRVKKESTIFYRVKIKDLTGAEQQVGDIIRLDTDGDLSGSIKK